MPQNIPALIWWLLTSIIFIQSTVTFYFVKRTISKIDANQSRLFSLYDDLTAQVNKLQGAHDFITNSGGHK